MTCDDIAERLFHQVRHYDYFFDRVLNMTPTQFNEKFELLLIFLVEAIGVPVLLSLLLLTYSSSSSGSTMARTTLLSSMTFWAAFGLFQNSWAFMRSVNAARSASF